MGEFGNSLVMFEIILLLAAIIMLIFIEFEVEVVCNIVLRINELFYFWVVMCGSSLMLLGSFTYIGSD